MYSENQYPLTVLLGILPRSGTNYLSKLLSYHPNIRHIPPDGTSGEIGLMAGMNRWKEAVRAFDKGFVNPGFPKNEIRFEDFAKYIGQSWIDYLVNRFQVQPGHLFLKEPCVWGLEHFYDLFPAAKLIVLLRDGRDQAASMMKSSLGVKRTTTRIVHTKAIINHLLWRDFRLNVDRWKKAALEINAFDAKYSITPRKSQYMILRYEDVYENPAVKMAEVFSFLELDYDDALLSRLTDADVVGSSFYSPDQKENATKPNWKPTTKTSLFKPVGRWRQWSASRKSVFKRIAGQQLIALGYERDLNW